MRDDYGFGQEQVLTNPVKGTGFDTPQVAGAIVILSLVGLIAIRRGFRGVNLAGVRVGVS